MSRFAILPLQALLDIRLSPRDITVLAALGSHTDKAGWCFPSLSRIGEMLGISRQAVQKSYKTLRLYGYVQSIAQFRDKEQTANLTRVLFDVIVDDTLQRLVAPPATPGVAPPATPGVALTSHINDSINVPSNDKDRGRPADRFDEFWTAYPKKVKRKDAKKVWQAKKLDALLETLLADIQERLKSDRRWREGFIPDPTTYLRGERWNDEIDRSVPHETNRKLSAVELVEQATRERERERQSRVIEG